MTDTRQWTPEEIEAVEKALEYVLCECESDDKTIDEAAAMLRQSAAALRRWEQLKAWAERNAPADVVAEMTRLEQEREG